MRRVRKSRGKLKNYETLSLKVHGRRLGESSAIGPITWIKSGHVLINDLAIDSYHIWAECIIAPPEIWLKYSKARPCAPWLKMCHLTPRKWPMITSELGKYLFPRFRRHQTFRRIFFRPPEFTRYHSDSICNPDQAKKIWLSRDKVSPRILDN